jgi:cysteinyl-tRNA synthetase
MRLIVCLLLLITFGCPSYAEISEKDYLKNFDYNISQAGLYADQWRAACSQESDLAKLASKSDAYRETLKNLKSSTAQAEAPASCQALRTAAVAMFEELVSAQVDVGLDLWRIVDRDRELEKFRQAAAKTPNDRVKTLVTQQEQQCNEARSSLAQHKAAYEKNIKPLSEALMREREKFPPPESSVPRPPGKRR